MLIPYENGSTKLVGYAAAARAADMNYNFALCPPISERPYCFNNTDVEGIHILATGYHCSDSQYALKYIM